MCKPYIPIYITKAPKQQRYTIYTQPSVLLQQKQLKRPNSHRTNQSNVYHGLKYSEKLTTLYISLHILSQKVIAVGDNKRKQDVKREYANQHHRILGENHYLGLDFRKCAHKALSVTPLAWENMCFC